MLVKEVFAFFVFSGRCVLFILYRDSISKEFSFSLHILCRNYTVTVRHEYSKMFVGLVCGSIRFVFDLYCTGLCI